MSDSASSDDGGLVGDLAGCTLLGRFGIILQAGLGLVALSTLLIKRSREVPKRPLKVWLMDASKQAIAQATIHSLSVIIAIILGGAAFPSGVDDACIWYFLNVILDTTVGVLILAVLQAGVRYLASRYRLKGLESGKYGKPPQLTIWLVQCAVFIGQVCIVKIVIGFFLWAVPQLGDWSSKVFEPVLENPEVELAIVMVIVPFVMNTFQFWAIDALIKDNEPAKSTNRSTRHGYDEDPDDGDVFMLSDNAYGIDSEL